MSNLKKHYFLISAIVISVPISEAANIDKPDVSVTVTSVPTNGIVISDHREFGVAQIAKAQQVAQQNFFRHVDHESVQVVDVIIQSINHLGFMTDAQFHGPKSPQQLQKEAEDIAKAAGVKLAVDNTKPTDRVDPSLPAEPNV